VRAGRRCIGFSGTNGTSDLLPVGFEQCDLPQTHETNAAVDALLKRQRCATDPLPATDTSAQLTALMALTPRPRVLIDRGALLDDDAAVVAQQWWDMWQSASVGDDVAVPVEGVVYYDHSNTRRIWTGASTAAGEGEAFAMSPLAQRLERCAVYLDDNHTRGVDVVLPWGTHAAVTLGRDVTRDAFAQACKRMRRLDGGKGPTQPPQTLVYVAPAEVLRQLGNGPPTPESVLRWTYANSKRANLAHLTAWADHEVVDRCKRRTMAWTQDDVDSLSTLYGGCQRARTFRALANTPRYATVDGVSERMVSVGGDHIVTCYRPQADDTMRTQTLDEEQERELEQELQDERQVDRPPRCIPHPPAAPTWRLDRHVPTLHHVFEMQRAFPGPDADVPVDLRRVFVTAEFQQVCARVHCSRPDYDPHASPGTPVHTSYARAPLYVLVDEQTGAIVALSLEEAEHAYKQLRHTPSRRYALRLVGQRLREAATYPRMTLDETPSLCVPQQRHVKRQPVGVTVLTGGTWYSRPRHAPTVRRWCTEGNALGRRYVEGWLACNGSVEWVAGSEVEGCLCGWGFRDGG